MPSSSNPERFEEHNKNNLRGCARAIEALRFILPSLKESQRTDVINSIQELIGDRTSDQVLATASEWARESGKRWMQENCVHGDGVQAYEVVNVPPRFEHLIAEYCRTPGGFPNRINFTDWLNQQGQQGWQLVSVVPRHSTLLECFFVRPV